MIYVTPETEWNIQAAIEECLQDAMGDGTGPTSVNCRVSLPAASRPAP